MPNPWADPRPFVLGPTDAQTAFVLVHGFTGSPAEMRPLGERLAARGHRVIGVQLPGHGSAPEALDGVRWEHWAVAVVEAVTWARENAERCVLAGLSMGGLLATVVVGAQMARVDAAVLFAPAFSIRDRLFPLVGLGRFVLDSVPAPLLPRAGLASLEGWKQLWHYDHRPVESVWQLRRLQKRAWRELQNVDVPTLIVQGRADLTLVPEGAAEAAKRIGPNAELLWLERSGHCLTVDVELDLVLGQIDQLLRSEDQGLHEPRGPD